MFEAKVEGLDPLLKKLEAFAKQIDELHQSVPQELADWQREDMHRKFPTVDVESSGNQISASTEIFPHSRLEAQEEAARRQSQRGPKVFSAAAAKPKQHRMFRAAPKANRGPLPASRRPILRRELEQKLHDRMVKLTSEAMKWP